MRFTAAGDPVLVSLSLLLVLDRDFFDLVSELDVDPSLCSVVL